MSKINIPKVYKDKIEKILGSSFSGNTIRVSFGEYNNSTEARLLIKQLTLIKKQLAAVKREANNDMKEIRLSYQSKKEKISESGGIVTQLFFGKKAAGRDRQRQRTALKEEQVNAVKPYENVKSIVDQLLLEIDRARLSIENNIANNSF